MTIERMKFTQVDEGLGNEREQLAKQAAKVLGYKRLARALVVPEALLFVLRKLDIEPLVTSGVAAYKATKARPGMWFGHKRAAALFLLTLFMAAVVAPYLNSTADWKNCSLGCFGTIGACIVTAVLFVIAMINACDSGMRGNRITRRWAMEPLASYAGNIPEFALAKAVAIKTECPTVSLFVERLHEDQEQIVRPTRDPFLVASLGDESYYIDVWDEKEYERSI